MNVFGALSGMTFGHKRDQFGGLYRSQAVNIQTWDLVLSFENFR